MSNKKGKPIAHYVEVHDNDDTIKQVRGNGTLYKRWLQNQYKPNKYSLINFFDYKQLEFINFLNKLPEENIEV